MNSKNEVVMSIIPTIKQIFIQNQRTQIVNNRLLNPMWIFDLIVHKNDK